MALPIDDYSGLHNLGRKCSEKRRQIVKAAPEVLLGLLRPGVVVDVGDGRSEVEIIWNPHDPLPADTQMDLVHAWLDERTGAVCMLVDSPAFGENWMDSPPTSYLTANVVCQERPSLRSRVMALVGEIAEDLNSDVDTEQQLRGAKKAIHQRLLAILDE